MHFAEYTTPFLSKPHPHPLGNPVTRREGGGGGDPAIFSAMIWSGLRIWNLNGTSMRNVGLPCREIETVFSDSPPRGLPSGGLCVCAMEVRRPVSEGGVGWTCADQRSFWLPCFLWQTFLGSKKPGWRLRFPTRLRSSSSVPRKNTTADVGDCVSFSSCSPPEDSKRTGLNPPGKSPQLLKSSTCVR